MSDPAECPRAISKADAAAIIGIVSRLTGEIWTGQIDGNSFRERGIRDGYLTDDAGQYELLQAFSDLVERVRFALGEYEKMPPSQPFPR